MQLSKEQRKFHINGLLNTRDLGGYETQGSSYTKTGRYIRSGNLANIHSDIVKELIKQGIEVVIDLRSKLECSKQSSVLIDEEQIIYYNVTLDQIGKKELKIDSIEQYSEMTLFYIYLLEQNKKQIKFLFELFDEHKYQTIAFHCLAGKDKAGIISALLLDLAGCHEYDIIKDYSESYHNNQEMIEKLESVNDPEILAFLESSPHTMIQFLGYLKETYGSSRGYLLDCGVSSQLIDEIIEDFTI